MYISQYKSDVHKSREYTTVDPSIIYLHWSLFFFWCIIIPQLKYHFLNLNLYILDEPDVQAEKAWIHADVGVEVEISCTIYAEPTAEVSNDQDVTNVLQMYILHENTMKFFLTSISTRNRSLSFGFHIIC